jgi:hypothetical protein
VHLDSQAVDVDQTGTIIIPQLNYVAPHSVLPLPPAPLDSNHARPDVLPPSPWLQSHFERMTFDYIIRRTLPYEHLCSSRYQLKVIEQEDGVQLDFQRGFSFSPKYDYLAKHHMMYLSEYMPGTMFALVTRNYKTHYSYVVDTPSCSKPVGVAQAQTTPIQAEEGYEPGVSVQFVLLCAASGRSVYRTFTRETGAKATHVADYHSFRSSPSSLCVYEDR